MLKMYCSSTTYYLVFVTGTCLKMLMFISFLFFLTTYKLLLCDSRAHDLCKTPLTFFPLLVFKLCPTRWKYDGEERTYPRLWWAAAPCCSQDPVLRLSHCCSVQVSRSHGLTEDHVLRCSIIVLPIKLLDVG